MGYTAKQTSKIKLIDLSSTAQVNSGGATNVQALRPAAGKIYEVIGIEYDGSDPSGSTSGTHYLKAEYTDGTDNCELFIITATTGNDVDIHYSRFVGDSAETPTAENPQVDLITGRRIICSNSVYVNFTYKNNTDANQTGTRELILIVKEYTEGT